MEERNFAKFELNMGFSGILYISTALKIQCDPMSRPQFVAEVGSVFASFQRGFPTTVLSFNSSPPGQNRRQFGR